MASAYKMYMDPKAWQNKFYKEVTCRIDEGTFSVLFDNANGAPNASVCRMVAMMLLKEGYRCSDEQLFEKCEFDLVARKALGLVGFEEEIPCPATYYNFRAALVKYQEDNGVDLLGKYFEQMTGKQAKSYGVSGKKIPADSLQNPNDPDATYRNKNEKPVQGYVTNVTETCGEEGKPSLITAVHVETATFADCHFLQDDIGQSERVTGDKVERCHADGAYQSPDNREFAKAHFLEDGETVDDMAPGHKVIELMTGKMQGGARFDLFLNGEVLTVVDKRTGETQIAVKSKAETYKGKVPMKRWRIPWQPEKGRPWRYFTEKDVKASELRRKIESLSPERNNVEAPMFQYSFHTRNNKTRYRGLAKHRMHAYARCMWMNFRRLAIFTSKSFCHLFCTILGFMWASVSHHKSFFEILSGEIRMPTEPIYGSLIPTEDSLITKNRSF